MAKHTKGARGSTWDKHTNRDKGKGQKKQQSSSWVDQGKHTNSPRNKRTKFWRRGWRWRRHRRQSIIKDLW